MLELSSTKKKIHDPVVNWPDFSSKNLADSEPSECHHHFGVGGEGIKGQKRTTKSVLSSDSKSQAPV